MDIISKIDEYLNKRQERERDEKLHISELGKSKKEIFKRFISTDEKPDKPEPQLQRIFDNGNFMHQRYYKYFAEMGILRAIEIKAVDNDLFSGTADCILSEKDGKPWLVDLKSCNSWVFKKLLDMKPEHKIQILFYMYFLNIEQGMVLYENKDDQNIKIFKIYLDSDNRNKVEKMIADLRRIKESIDKNIIPDDLINDDAKLEDLLYI
jgi:CRISPR/Cas system-associated exonuclease Cas4 (RecB family)